MLKEANTAIDCTLRVGFVEAGSGQGGSALSLLRILRAIRKHHQNEVAITVVLYAETAEKLFRDNGFDCLLLEHHRFLGGRALLAKHKLNLLHCNNAPYGHAPLILAAKSRGIPTTVHFRCSRMVTRMESFLFRFVYHCFTVSDSGAEAVAKRMKRQKVSCLGDGVDLTRWQWQPESRKAVRESLGITDRQTAILLPATLQPGKGQDTAVKASELLNNDSVVWLFAGAEHYQFPGYRQELQQLIGKDNSNIKLLGHRDDMPELMAACDITALPSSLTEGLPCILIEALAAGKPLIASRVGGIPEVVNDDVGRLISPGSPEELADAVRLFLDSPGKPATFADACRQMAEERYSIEAVSEKLLHIFRAAVSDLRNSAT